MKLTLMRHLKNSSERKKQVAGFRDVNESIKKSIIELVSTN